MFFKFLSKDDIFISYSRRDGASYAAGLADKLTARKFSCFIDKLGTEPDRDLPASLRRTIHNCTLLVVVGTECGAASEFVAKEIEEFKKTKRTIVPIDFDGAVARARWYELIPGLAAEAEENPDARKSGDPSPNVVSRIEKSFNYTRRNQRMMRLMVATLSLFFVLIAASGVAAYVASANLNEARKQSRAAEEATARAEKATARAEKQTRIATEAAARAEEQTHLAEASTRRAEEAARQAKDAERQRTLAEKKTAEATRLERQARAQADAQQKRAEEEQRRANEQQLRAEEQFKRSTNLVYASSMLVAQQSQDTGKDDYGQSLLDSYRPLYGAATAEGDGAGDLRGFEWRYLWRVYHKRYVPDPERLRPTAVAFSPDGQWLAAADVRGGLTLWDTSNYFYSTGMVTLTKPGARPRGQNLEQELSDALAVLAFSPDSKLLAAGTMDGKLQLFEVAARQSLPLEFKTRSSAVTSLAFSADGKTLAAGFEAGPPLFCDVASRRQLETPAVLGADASAVAYSPDGKWLAFGQGERVSLWDLAGGRSPFALDGEAQAVKRLLFSPDSMRLAATSADGKAIVWDIASRKKVEAARRLDGQAEELAFSPDGRMIATTGPDPDAAKLWDAATYEELETLPIAASRVEEKESVYQARQRRTAQRQQRLSPRLRGHGLAFSPDSATLAGWGGLGALVLWNTSPNPVVLEAESGVAGATYSPDGKVIVTTGDDGTINVWDAFKRTRKHSLQVLETGSGEESGFSGKRVFAFSPDGRTLVVNSGDGRSVTLFETVSYTALFTFQAGESSDDSEGYVKALAFSPDGSHLAVGVGQVTNLYDATKLRGPSPPVPLARLVENTDPVVLSDENDPSDVASLVFLRGGQVIAASGTYMVRLWDVKTHSLLWKFPFSWTHEGALGDLTLSPDGRQLAVSTRFWLRLYDVELLLAGDARKYLSLTGPGNVAGKLSFSPDGKTLASGMEDGSVKLWNTVAGQELIALKGHTGEVKSVAFSPDGMVLTTGGDSTLKFWLAASERDVRAQRTYEPPGD